MLYSNSHGKLDILLAVCLLLRKFQRIHGPAIQSTVLSDEVG